MSTSASPTATTLSEAEAKSLLSGFGVPLLDERQVLTPTEAASAATELGLPVVCKLNGDNIAHKTERGLVRLNLATTDQVSAAAEELLAAATPADGDVSVLVAPMVSGIRELIAGVATDPQFGPTVMLGVGGVLAEAIADVVFRLIPLNEVDATDMIDDLTSQSLLGAFRGEPEVDRKALAQVLLALSATVEARPDVTSVDLNPLIVVDGKPIAVDALVELAAAERNEVAS